MVFLKKVWKKVVSIGRSAWHRIISINLRNWQGILLVVLIIATVFTGGMMIYTQIDKKQNEKEYERLQQLASQVIPEEDLFNIEEATPTPVLEEDHVVTRDYPNLDLDFTALKEINADITGWIYIPAIELSYPVVKTSDNIFYLEHSFEKENSIYGALFMDFEDPINWSGYNTFIFGHNMKDGSMFGSLKRFMREKGLLASDPFIYVYTEDEILIYEVFSMYVAEDGSQRYRIVRDREDADLYVDEARDLTTFTPNEYIENIQNIISLSTCYGAAGTTQRLLIHGALIDWGKRE